MDKETEVPARKQATLNVDFGPALLLDLEAMRRTIQDSLGGTRNLTRGDVVRLAVRRLYLALLSQAPALESERATNVTLWQSVAREIQDDQTCPPWLVPGQAPDSPVPFQQPKKEKKKCKRTKRPTGSGRSANDSSKQDTAST